MDNLPGYIEKISFPEAFQNRLVGAVVPGLREEETIYVQITSDDQNLPIRQFAHFLMIFDRLVARMHPLGIRNYARTESSQLKIDYIQSGSVEAIVRDIANYLDPPRIVLVWALLKYLPKIIATLSSSISDLARAYKEFQEGKTARLNNAGLKRQLQDDQKLSRLEGSDLDLLAKIMTYLFARESPHLKQAARFVEEHVREISIERKRSE